ncbi:SIS domain-containing protein [Plantactinospora sp. ZYX-F-223]|uniref:D-sedoheptulose-7-phosphate isomerase n=1 Tax=Plantactinospora sp. ZYX-F-223 TaxID=3144103 RepID=UPI0031FDD626
MIVPTNERLAPAAGAGPAPTGAETVVKQYVDDLTLALAQLETGAVTDLLETLVLALHSGSRVFVAGNGGSSTAAIHIASDLMAAAGPLGGAPQVVALTENIARVTAIANDHSYDEIFSRQLVGWGRPRDVLLLLSVSGHSTNLVRAATVGRHLGMTVLAALGNAGDLARLADRLVVFGQADYGLTEDLHVALGHMAVRVLRGGDPCRYTGSTGDGGPAGATAERAEVGEPGESLQF